MFHNAATRARAPKLGPLLLAMAILSGACSSGATTPTPGNTATATPAAQATPTAASSTAATPAASVPATPSVPQVSQADIDTAMKTPTTLTFWSWVPNIDKEIALFQAKYPAIKINLVNAGQGTPHYTKLRTALQAGTGAPDVAQIEYQYIPTFSITGGLVDLRPYGAEALSSQFVDWTWGQVKGQGGEVWAIPQDSGPMGLLYRKDIFDKYGITTPPKTWDEFLADAKTIHAADPKVYIADVPPAEQGQWVGLMWQAGSKPFGVTSKTDVKVAVNDAASKKVAAYWQQLIQQGLVATDPDFTDAWYQGLASGKYASWPSAAWGPVFLQGAVKGTSGDWRAAPLPQWDASSNVSANWGGSTTAVIKGTKNPVASAMFAEFLNTDPASAMMFTTLQNFYPSQKAVLADPTFAGQTPAFFGGQKVNQVFADISSTVDPSFQWPPFLDQTYTDYTNTVGKAITAKGDLSAAVDAWQQATSTYAKDQGFNVSQ